MRFLQRVWSDEKGEDLTEYALIVGLIALAVIAGAGILGGAFNDWYVALAGTIASIPGA